jgi:tRNA nucleotidyltransferase (CCA-adding enzyme)
VAHRLSSSPALGRSDIFFLLDPLPADFLLYAMGRAEEEGVKKAISLYFTELKRARVSLSGKDLKKMGFIPAPFTRRFSTPSCGEAGRENLQPAGRDGLLCKKYT